MKVKTFSLLFFCLVVYITHGQINSALHSKTEYLNFTDTNHYLKTSKINFKSTSFPLNTPITNNSPFSIYEINQVTYSFNSVEFTNRLFSNIEIVENTYKDYSDFFRLCSPLEDGIANNESGADRILSMVLNNFINNVVLTKGIFGKKKYSFERKKKN